MVQPASKPAESKSQRRSNQQRPDPSPAEIAKRAAEVQSTWTRDERRKRGEGYRPATTQIVSVEDMRE